MLNVTHLLILKSLTRPLTVAQWKKVIAKFSLIDVTTQQLYGSFSSLFPEYALTEFLAAENKAKEILQQCQKNNIQLIGYFDATFPGSLKNIEQPPVLLFIKGEPSLLLSQMSLAVIGTREPSERGLKTATKISERLAKAGYVIISGLAVGCDTAAHRGCLLGEGKTIAILAHGLDSVYPTQNISLAKEIIEKGGCLISEYPPGTKANPSYFIKRDRLQSALSQAVLIIESNEKSGTMHTASYAKKQGKPIACLNYLPEILKKDNTIKITGNQKLCKEGAASFVDKEELFLFLEQLTKKKTSTISNFFKAKLTPTTQESNVALDSSKNTSASSCQSISLDNESLLLRPEKPSCFIGREELLIEMQAHFLDCQKTTTNIMILLGENGIGKTALAKQYAWQERTAYPGGVLFIPAVDKTAISAYFHEIAKKLDIDVNESNNTDLWQKLYSHLLINGNLLVILDGAGSFAEIEAFFNTNNSIHFLVTSAESEGWEFSCGYYLCVPLFSPEEKFAYLEATCHSLLSTADKSYLVETLDSFPVSLSISAFMINQDSWHSLQSTLSLCNSSISNTESKKYPQLISILQEMLRQNWPDIYQKITLLILLSPATFDLNGLNADLAKESLAVLSSLIRFQLIGKNGDTLSLHWLLQCSWFETMTVCEKTQGFYSVINLLLQQAEKQHEVKKSLLPIYLQIEALQKQLLFCEEADIDWYNEGYAKLLYYVGYDLMQYKVYREQGKSYLQLAKTILLAFIDNPALLNKVEELLTGASHKSNNEEIAYTSSLRFSNQEKDSSKNKQIVLNTVAKKRKIKEIPEEALSFSIFEQVDLTSSPKKKRQKLEEVSEEDRRDKGNRL